MKAYCLIRNNPWYRREAFIDGLKAAGHTIATGMPDSSADRNTLLVIWNRYGENQNYAKLVESRGGVVIVAENGYVSAGGGTPKFDVYPAGAHNEHYYAIAHSYHNDCDVVHSGVGNRWSTLGIEVKPWRVGGDYILVCPNRSFGIPGRMMHPDWHVRVAKRLSERSSLPVRIRAHPGNDRPLRPLSDDLAGAAAVVIWSSSCGVHALIEGIPVICESPYWICKGASVTVDDLEREPVLHDRMPALHRMAWAQWTVDEIQRGEPFKHILGEHG